MMAGEKIKEAWMVIVNPKAGSGKGLTDWPVISNQMNRSGVDFSCVFTERKYHAVELAVKAVNDGYRKLVAIGGDGTINEIVNGLFIQQKVAPADVSLAVIPAGTGNDWLRMFGIPDTYSKAVQSIVNHRTILQDVGLITFYETRIKHQRYMANVAGLGFDAMVNRLFNHLKDEGRYSKNMYLRGTFRTLLSYHSKQFSVTVDDRLLFKGSVFSAAVGIGKYNGGGMNQMPNAVVDDGLFDITIVKQMNPLKVLYHFRKLYNGKIYRIPKVLARQGKRVVIDTLPESPIEIDGEAMGYSPFTFELIPKSIKVVVGADYANG
ncbi:MAG: diacylglycerol kinase family lipid kinase [Prevotellaceae bacterium]|jgi:YegS/Rv2252/BmrU family lipid kinase|nr:diacylglycerol kinase family lipid kinase [Prevotellaceae bacterium]